MQPIYSVSEFTFAIKTLIEPKFQSVGVQGEISNLKLHSSGHIYFSLKDKTAQVSCVFFKGNVSKCPRVPKDGDHITIYGDLSIYPPRGNYQIIVRKIELMGMGELLLKFQQLKEKLQNLGRFDQKHKKPLRV